MTSPVRRALAIFLTGVLGCSSDLLMPDPTGGDGIVAFTKVGGDDQSGPVGETLPFPLTVQVLRGGEQPVVGLEVAFELSEAAAGSVSPLTATTNSQGEAVAHWTLGTVPGSYVVIARPLGVEESDQIAEFRAAAKPAAPDTLTPSTPLAQPGRKEHQVATPPQVRVVDRFGNPVPDVPVAWQVTAGEGQVTSPITTTDGEGKASVQWTLGDRLGVHKLTAAIESATGSPVTFTAHVLF
jgi:Bacterial Ig-like domain (group 1)